VEKYGICERERPQMTI